MSNNYVTLVVNGGTPVRLADQRGAPYPTTGTGSLVFAEDAVLTNPTLNGFTIDPSFPITVTTLTVTGDFTAESGVVMNGDTSGSTRLIASAVAGGTITLPSNTTYLVGTDTTNTLINKTMSGVSNTFQLIPVTALNNGTSASATTFWRGDGTWAAASGAGVSLTVGTTLVTGGTTGQVLYDNAGVLGEMTNTGSGTVNVLQTSPTLITPALGVATATSVAIGGATIGANGLAVTGTVLFNDTLTYGGVTLANSVTGTGSMVLSASPTFTGTMLAAAATFSDVVTHSSTTTLTGALTYGGVTLSNAVTGTGNMVLSAAPTFTGVPISPTAAAFNNSTQIATTAYADRVGVQQVVSTITGAVATGTTTVTGSDTAITSSQGDQYMSLAITPKSATSKLIIEVTWWGSMNIAPGQVWAALFQDSTTPCLASGVSQPASGFVTCVKFTYVMASGTTSETTFKVRAGGNSANTTTFNGTAGGRYGGGTMASSIVITEIGS